MSIFREHGFDFHGGVYPSENPNATAFPCERAQRKHGFVGGEADVDRLLTNVAAHFSGLAMFVKNTGRVVIGSRTPVSHTLTIHPGPSLRALSH